MVIVLIVSALLSCSWYGVSPAGAADSDRQIVAEVLGRTVYADELVPAKEIQEQKAKLAPRTYTSWYERTQGEKLRTLVWSAVFSDYAQKRHIEPTPAEIESNMNQTRKFVKEDRIRRNGEREALMAELKSPRIAETRRKQAQQYLDTLNSLHEHDVRMEKERSDSAREKMWQDSERRVSEMWVKQWKLNPALYREFGGRIIFQQAGWEPIDAYRRLLEQYEAKKAFVVHDPALRETVYSYFKHHFVYADEKKARFYFEKPFWERTPAEMKAAGF